MAQDQQQQRRQQQRQQQKEHEEDEEHEHEEHEEHEERQRQERRRQQLLDTPGGGCGRGGRQVAPTSWFMAQHLSRAYTLGPQSLKAWMDLTNACRPAAGWEGRADVIGAPTVRGRTGQDVARKREAEGRGGGGGRGRRRRRRRQRWRQRRWRGGRRAAAEGGGGCGWTHVAVLPAGRRPEARKRVVGDGGIAAVVRHLITHNPR